MNVILCSGFDESLYPQVRVECGLNPTIITLQKGDLPLTLGQLAERAENSKSASRLTSESKSDSLLKKTEGAEPLEKFLEQKLDGHQRYVIFSGQRSDLDSVMQSIKKIYQPPARSVIYAMLTATAKTWTLEKYLLELAQEHEEMRDYHLRLQAQKNTVPNKTEPPKN